MDELEGFKTTSDLTRTLLARAVLAMSELGLVTQRGNQFVAKINTKDLGKQYRFTGPLRGEDEQQAYQDLYSYRPQANGGGHPVRLKNSKILPQGAQVHFGPLLAPLRFK